MLTTVCWIIAGICVRLLPGAQIPLYGNVSRGVANDLFFIFAALALAIVFIIQPFRFYWRSGSFIYEASWFPIRPTARVIEEAQHGTFRAERKTPYDIALILRIPGQVDAMDIQLHSPSNSVTFTLGDELPTDISAYPKNQGFRFDREMNNDIVTPILQIERIGRLAGGPDTYVYVYDVSKNDTGGPLPPDELKRDGNELLKIKVTD
ncbi:hypothetical protein [Halalkalicoccus subterraneus]|uniref:hypothetical protein n=1 Tax=Halalkalicoccus subterraneus TaxID=2675002 RepID=UPI0013CE66A3|nr:hypothetical protein [Halalkalicoccus subterraneus]